MSEEAWERIGDRLEQVLYGGMFVLALSILWTYTRVVAVLDQHFETIFLEEGK